MGSKGAETLTERYGESFGPKPNSYPLNRHNVPRAQAPGTPSQHGDPAGVRTQDLLLRRQTL